MTNFTIFCGAFTRFIYNFKKVNPFKKENKATLIDYDVVALMLPSVFLGTLIGVILNTMTPNIIIVIILTIILIGLSLQSFLKAGEIRKRELAEE